MSVSSIEMVKAKRSWGCFLAGIVNKGVSDSSECPRCGALAKGQLRYKRRQETRVSKHYPCRSRKAPMISTLRNDSEEHELCHRQAQRLSSYVVTCAASDAAARSRRAVCGSSVAPATLWGMRSVSDERCVMCMHRAIAKRPIYQQATPCDSCVSRKPRNHHMECRTP